VLKFSLITKKVLGRYREIGMRDKRGLEVWVGLFAGVGIVALAVLAYSVGNLGSYSQKTGYSLLARFDEIGGLKERAPVTMSGVQVGRVSSIKLDSVEYRAIVELQIDPEKFPLQRVTETGEQPIKSDGSKLYIPCGAELPTDSAEYGQIAFFEECATALYDDAVATILTSGMLGEQYVGIEPGGAGITFLLPGDEIMLTQSSIALEQIIGQFLFNSAGKK